MGRSADSLTLAIVGMAPANTASAKQEARSQEDTRWALHGVSFSSTQLLPSEKAEAQRRL